MHEPIYSSNKWVADDLNHIFFASRRIILLRKIKSMQIDVDLLYTWGAIAKKYKKNDVIFDEGCAALFYFQVIEGTVRMYNSNSDGKEFTQGFFSDGSSFGEPPLLIDEIYPATAIAMHDCSVLKLAKEKFLKILDEYPTVQKSFLTLMAQRIHAKANTSKEIINQRPEFRIQAFMSTYKKKNTCASSKILIPYTRQEIANFTGLRVETVIRALTKMNGLNKVDIINHKIYF